MLVALSALAWGWRFAQAQSALPRPVAAQQQDTAQAPDPAQWLRLLGRGGALPDASNPSDGAAARYRLQGVIASLNGQAGVALIAIDGQAARAYPVGARVEGDWLLQAVGPRSARLGVRAGAPVLRLELPTASAPGPAPALSDPGEVAPQAAAVAGVRMVTPGEVTAPGRRLRLRSRATDAAPELP